MKRKFQKARSAFTLAELIVVITVLAILATVGFVMLSWHLSSARDSSRITEVWQISRSVELSAIQIGKYPMPVASESVPLVTFTGGVSGNALVTQWAATSANVRDLGSSFGKKKQTGPIAYSVLGGGTAYQVAAEFENGVSRTAPSDVPEAYAASKTAYVDGTYKADPSLPSLIVSSGSVTGTWLFSPDACFVTHGGSNLFTASVGCVPKKSFPLKSVDPSLAGYWDMETVCSGGSCGAGNDGKLADLSGNGNHGIANWTPSTWGTGGIMGKATELDGVNDYYQIANSTNLNFSGPFSITAIYGYSKGYSGMGNNPIIQKPFTSYVAPYYQYHMGVVSPNYAWTSWLCGFSLSTTTSVSTYKFLGTKTACGGFNWQSHLATVRYDWKTISVWMNGLKQSEEVVDLSNADTWKDVFIGAQWNALWSANSYLAGTVDEIKLYNKALSDSEILQQSKAAWF